VGLPLSSQELNYESVGATHIDEKLWRADQAGFRHLATRVEIGRGQDCWEQSRAALLAWGVKTRSGFTVEAAAGDSARVVQGADFWLIANVGPWRVREPVRVVAVIDELERCGFAYGTLTGHPVSGEEAFILDRTSDGSVWLTLRSLTRPPKGPWRLAYPLVLIAQRWYRRRYQRALRLLPWAVA
jgi:uncharacterized protein (UPF0548 family)